MKGLIWVFTYNISKNTSLRYCISIYRSNCEKNTVIMVASKKIL